MKPLILIGGGGHCKSVIDAAESAGWTIKGILDMPDVIGTNILNYKVIGADDDISKYIDNCEFIVTLGFIKNPEPRINLHLLLEKLGGKLATIIAPTAHVSKHAIVKEGSVILNNATVNAGAYIGKGCIINTGANIEHDVYVGEYSHISTGTMINGNCIIGDRTLIGSGSVVSNGINIAAGSLIGAGSSVIRNIEASGVYVGVPAKKIK